MREDARAPLQPHTREGPVLEILDRALSAFVGRDYTPAATAAGSAAISRARSSSLIPPQTP